MKRWLISIIVLMIGFFIISFAEGATVLSFEDLHPIVTSPEYYEKYDTDGETGPMPEGFGGFNWGENFYWNNASNDDPDSGWGKGATSGYYQAYNAWGKPVGLTVSPINFEGANFTSAILSEFDLQIQGYYEGSIQHTQTITINNLEPTLLAFGYTGLVDRLDFTPIFPSDPDAHTIFVMDDFAFVQPVPLPGAILFLGCGLVGLVSARYRRKLT